MTSFLLQRSTSRLLTSRPRLPLLSRSSPHTRLVSSHPSLLPTTTRSLHFGGPAPPRLPEKEQREFEALQRASTGAFSTPRSEADLNAELDAITNGSTSGNGVPQDQPTVNQVGGDAARVNHLGASLPLNHASAQSSPVAESSLSASASAAAQSEPPPPAELHPNIRRGAPPEFEGERNPTTGEVGGPKNEPLRWGKDGDWSYNGRVTDF